MSVMRIIRLPPDCHTQTFHYKPLALVFSRQDYALNEYFLGRTLIFVDNYSIALDLKRLVSADSRSNLVYCKNEDS
jgi:hypothetical protein